MICNKLFSIWCYRSVLFLEVFEHIWDTVLLFSKEKTLEHCFSEFWAYIGFLCSFFWETWSFKVFWVKNLRKRGDSWVIFSTVAKVGLNPYG